MGRQKKGSSGSGRVVGDHDKADDLVYDVRLDRRMRRRNIAHYDFNINYSFSKGIFGKVPNKVTQTEFINIVSSDDEGSMVDDDFKKFFDGFASEQADDVRDCDNGDSDSGDMLPGERSANVDAEGDGASDGGDPPPKKVMGCNNIEDDDDNEGEYEDEDYMTYFLELESSVDSNVHRENLVNDGVNAKAVNEPVENGTGEQGLLVVESMDDNACGNCYGTAGGGSIETRSADDNDDLVVDSQYKVFLDSIRADGKSFVLEIPISDGFFVIYKYEADDGPQSNCRVENPNTTKHMQKAAGIQKHERKCEMKCDYVDDVYKKFLDSLKREGKYVVYMPESGAKVVYGGDEESSSDTEVIVMDIDPFADRNHTPFVTSKPPNVVQIKDEDECAGNKSSPPNDCSWFREGVTEILKKPYDEKEYDKLYKEASHRRPVKYERDMRNGRTRVYSAGITGNSYLDLHKDLEKGIRAAGSNRPKILNLLRGFFYWLQNVAHDRIFKPWTDSSCLEVLPLGNVSDSHSF